MSEWRTIDSAPKDKMVLVYCDWIGAVLPATLRGGGGRWKGTGWTVVFSAGYKGHVHGTPSHWMPLPEPPTSHGGHALPATALAAIEKHRERATKMEIIGNLFVGGKTYDQIFPIVGMNRNHVAGIIKRLGLRRTPAPLPEPPK